MNETKKRSFNYLFMKKKIQQKQNKDDLIEILKKSYFVFKIIDIIYFDLI
jgi:hypothetical protein